MMDRRTFLALGCIGLLPCGGGFVKRLFGRRRRADCRGGQCAPTKVEAPPKPEPKPSA